MKVLMLTSVFPRWPGDATPPFVQNQAELLSASGVKVSVLTPHAKGAARCETWNGVDVYRHVYAWPFGFQALCYQGGILVNLESRPWTRLLLPFFFLSQLIATVRLCIKLEPDIIHSHSLVPQGFTAALASRLMGIPHLATSHGNDLFGLKPTGLMGLLKRKALELSNAVTVNGRASIAAVRELNPQLPDSKIHWIPAVPNAGQPDPATVESIRACYPAKKRILFVGRMIREKGIFDLLDALGEFLPQHPEVSALFVGDGVELGKLESRVAAANLSRQIHLAGWQAKEAIPSWMAAVDLLVVPSHREAQGLVIVEAMAVGTPVVAARVGGIPDLVRDGETGTLVEPGDVDGLCRAIHETLQARDALRGISENAHALYDAQYSQAAVRARLLEVYEQVGTQNR